MKHIPELKTFDIVLILIYLFWCFGLIMEFNYGFFEFHSLKKAIQLTGFGSALLIYGPYNKKLRNNKIFIAWLLIGIFQFVIYLTYKELPRLSNSYGSILSPIKGLLFSVLTYRFIRFLYYKIFKRELIITSGGDYVGSRSFEEYRTIGKADFIFSILGGLIITLATILP